MRRKRSSNTGTALTAPNGLWSAAQYSEEFRNSRTTAVGAWEGSLAGDTEKLIGMAFTSRVFEEAALTNLAVHPDSRGRGIGKLLLEEIMRLEGAAGATRFTLEVRESNLVAALLYAKVGLACVGRRKRYYRRPTEDALIFEGQLCLNGSIDVNGLSY